MKPGGLTYRIPYGKTSLEFCLPSGMRGTVVQPRSVEPLARPAEAVAAALARPVGTPPLRQLVRPGTRVCIVFTDATRASPDHIFVPALLAELERAGVRDEDITLLCATGMHRPSTMEEKVFKLGEEIVTRYRVLDNEPQNPRALVDLGTTANGVPVLIHRAAVEADLLIATGIVEPHQYAGYSGGFKTVAVGAAGEALITFTHGPAFIAHPRVRLGQVEDNPFQEAITEAAQRAGLRFIVNAVLDAEGRVLKVASGDPRATFSELVAFARTVYEVEIPHQYDVVIGGVGWPKDVNLYQASRAASYLVGLPTPAVRRGGFVIIPAPCPEGAGAGIGEQRFLAAMRDAPDVQAILCAVHSGTYPAGQQRAFVMAMVLEYARVIIVGSECPDVVAACKMVPVATMEQALDLASSELGKDLDVLIVPHALVTLPIVQRSLL